MRKASRSAKSKPRSGARLGVRLGLVTGGVAAAAMALLVILLVRTFSPYLGGGAGDIAGVGNHLTAMQDSLTKIEKSIKRVKPDESVELTELRRSVRADLEKAQGRHRAAGERLAEVSQSLVAERDAESQGLLVGLIVALLGGVVVGLAAFLQGGQISSRLTELGLAVSKLGRGNQEVRVRVAGNDEVAALGSDLHYLAEDLSAMHQELESGGGSVASLDPQIRELRDKALESMPQCAGFELDAIIGSGSRGGLDYYGAHVAEDSTGVVWVVSAEGSSALSVFACRAARDEIARAAESGASARKILSHANRVLHRKLPRGACAKATVFELHEGGVKLYQAGYRAPVWICQAGEMLELTADGLALGLDAGPVFEKGLRPEEIPMQPGVRLVQSNDAGARMQPLLDLVKEHSPKHTMPFMNLVMGAIEEDAGGEGLREDVLLVTVKKA